MMDPEAEFELELHSVDFRNSLKDESLDLGHYEGDGDDHELLLEDGQRPVAGSDSPLEKHAITTKVGILKLQAWWIGTQFFWLLLMVVVMPSQVRSLVGDEHKGKTTGLITASGAVFSLVGSPLMGLISDRSMSPWGRRRPFMVAGCVWLSVSLLGMAASAPHIVTSSQHAATEAHVKCGGPLPTNMTSEHPVVETATVTGSLASYTISYMSVSAAYVMQSVPYTGLMADKTHSDVRGFSSGVMGAGSTAGMLLGSVAGFFFTDMGIWNAYLLIIAVLWLTGLVPMTMVRDVSRSSAAPPEKIDCRAVAEGYLKPLANHDFRWVFLTRFLMQQGVSTVTGFLEYSMGDKFELPAGLSPERAVALALAPMLVLSVVSSVLAGWISDYYGKRRKAIVIAASIGMAGCCICLAAFSSFYAAIAVSAMFGLFYGAFLSVDFAMVIDVLPGAKDYAKDMAVWHAAIALPNMLAAPTGGWIRDTFQTVACGCRCGFGYIVLYSVAAVYFALCAILVLRIKGVK